MYTIKLACFKIIQVIPDRLTRLPHQIASLSDQTDTGTTHLVLHRQFLGPRTVGCEAACHGWRMDHQTACSSQRAAAADACPMRRMASRAVFADRLTQPGSRSLPVLVFDGCTCRQMVTACRTFLSHHLTTRSSLWFCRQQPTLVVFGCLGTPLHMSAKEKIPVKLCTCAGVLQAASTVMWITATAQALDTTSLVQLL